VDEEEPSDVTGSVILARIPLIQAMAAVAAAPSMPCSFTVSTDWWGTLSSERDHERGC
jgi:hypothetical protein